MEDGSRKEEEGACTVGVRKCKTLHQMQGCLTMNNVYSES